MKQFTVYIAGPIGNTTDFRERFCEGCNEVVRLGHIPVSPIEIAAAHVVEGDWLACMKADIRALLECDGLYALRNWEMSRGARIEHFIAHTLGYTIIYQPEEANANRS